MFPLRARGQGFGVGSAFGAVATASSSVIFGLFQQSDLNPMIFLTVCGILNILVLMFLP